GLDRLRAHSQIATARFGIASERLAELQHLRRILSRDLRLSAILFEIWPRALVTPPLIVSERFLKWTPAGPPLVHPLRQHVGVAESVAHAIGADWILMVSRVAYQRPAMAKGAAKEVWQVAMADEVAGSPPTAHALQQRWGALERAQVGPPRHPRGRRRT